MRRGVTGPGDLWLVFQLARGSLESGTLRDYWPGLKRHGTETGPVTRGVATLVWLALVPVIPAVAARRRRLIATALEGVVRAMLAGVEMPAAVSRAVTWLQRKGVEPVQGRADLERLLSGFLSSRQAGDARPAESDSDLTSAG